MQCLRCERAMDTAWQLPLDDEYDELLKSNFADMEFGYSPCHQNKYWQP
jgi:leucyl aminopeptidase